MPKLIVLEGPDGSGKTTQIEMLRATYPDVKFTREPGGTPFAEELRKQIFATPEATAREHFDMFWLAREDHIKNLILPAINAGTIVVTDRFDLSTFAYQICGFEHRGELAELFWQQRRDIVEKILGARVHYIYLDVVPEISMARLSARSGEVTHFDQKPLEFHERVHAGGHEFIDRVRRPGFSSMTTAVVDASLDEQQVYLQICASIEQVLS